MGSSSGGRFPAPLSASWMTDLDEATLQSIICAFQVRHRLGEKGWHWTQLCLTQISSHWLPPPSTHHLQSADPPRSAGGPQGPRGGWGDLDHLSTGLPSSLASGPTV